MKSHCQLFFLCLSIPSPLLTSSFPASPTKDGRRPCVWRPRQEHQGYERAGMRLPEGGRAGRREKRDKEREYESYGKEEALKFISTCFLSSNLKKKKSTHRAPLDRLARRGRVPVRPAREPRDPHGGRRGEFGVSRLVRCGEKERENRAAAATAREKGDGDVHRERETNGKKKGRKKKQRRADAERVLFLGVSSLSVHERASERARERLEISVPAYMERDATSSKRESEREK